MDIHRFTSQDISPRCPHCKAHLAPQARVCLMCGEVFSTEPCPAFIEQESASVIDSQENDSSAELISATSEHPSRISVARAPHWSGPSFVSMLIAGMAFTAGGVMLWMGLSSRGGVPAARAAERKAIVPVTVLNTSRSVAPQLVAEVAVSTATPVLLTATVQVATQTTAPTAQPTATPTPVVVPNIAPSATLPPTKVVAPTHTPTSTSTSTATPTAPATSTATSAPTETPQPSVTPSTTPTAQPTATLTPVVVPNIVPSATLAPTKVADKAKVVAILACPRLEFAANSYRLLPDSEQALLTCAVPVLRQNSALFVGVKGSAAWPGPKGTVSRDQVEAAAKARAQAVINFLASRGIAQNRFVLQWTLPPPEHRETNDLILQAQDRYIEISLLSSGL